jgi:hypothetical protein
VFGMTLYALVQFLAPRKHARDDAPREFLRGSIHLFAQLRPEEAHQFVGARLCYVSRKEHLQSALTRLTS